MDERTITEQNNIPATTNRLDSIENNPIIKLLVELCDHKELQLIIKPEGLVQIQGPKYLVNYYPHSPRRALYMSGMDCAYGDVTPEEATDYAKYGLMRQADIDNTLVESRVDSLISRLRAELLGDASTHEIISIFNEHDLLVVNVEAWHA